MRKRYTRVLSLVVCALVALWSARAMSSPSVQPWSMDGPYKLYGDTLSHNRAGATTDSMVISDSVGVSGARAIYLTVVSDGNDSLLVSGSAGANGPLAVQFKQPNGTWTSLSALAIGAPIPNQSFITNVTKINNQAVTVYSIAMTDAGSGTPYPTNASMMRVRLKSADTRDWLNAGTATGAGMTGKITVLAYLWR